MEFLTKEFDEHYLRLKNYMEKLNKINVNEYFDDNFIWFGGNYKKCKELKEQSINALADIEYCKENIEVVHTELDNFQQIIDNGGEVGYEFRKRFAYLNSIKYTCQRAFEEQNIVKIKLIIDKCKQTAKYRKWKIADICFSVMQFLVCIVEYVLIFNYKTPMRYIILGGIVASVILVIIFHSIMFVFLKKLLSSKTTYRMHLFFNLAIFFVIAAFQSIYLLEFCNENVVNTVILVLIFTTFIHLFMYFANCIVYINRFSKEDKLFGFVDYYSIVVILSYVLRAFVHNQIVSIIITVILVIFTCLVFAFLVKVVCLNDKNNVKQDIAYVIIGTILFIIACCDIIYRLTWKVGAESQDLFNSSMTVFAAVLGGIITLAGVSWTINYNKKMVLLEDKKKYKPVFIIEEDLTWKSDNKIGLTRIVFYKKDSDCNMEFSASKFKNIGDKTFGICKFCSSTDKYSANIDGIKWIEPNQEFIISLCECSELINSIGKLIICDTLKNMYEYDLQFDNIYRVCKMSNGVEIDK